MLSFLRKLFADRPTPVVPDRFRPQVSALEAREVPAVNVTASGGFMVIQAPIDQPRGNIIVEAGAPGGLPISVVEDGVTRGYSWDGVPITDIHIECGTVTLFPTAVHADPTGSLTLRNLSVTGFVSASFVGVQDRITLSGTCSASGWDFEGLFANNSLVLDNANVRGSVSASHIETVRLQGSANLNGSLFVRGNSVDEFRSGRVERYDDLPVLVEIAPAARVNGSVTLDSDVADLQLYGDVNVSVSVNTSSEYTFRQNLVAMYPGAWVAFNLTVGQADLGGGRSTVSMEGQVGGSVTAYGSSMPDVVYLAWVGGNVTVNTGGGNDYVFVFGTIGANAGSQTANIRTGEGNDWVEVGAAARTDSLVCQLEGGNDTFILRTGAVFSSMLVTGGAGTDSFYGVRTLPNLWLGTFEVFG